MFECSRYRDKQLLTLTSDHYEGGTTDQTTLVVKNASRHDQGVYDCGLENDVGSQNSSNSIYVNIYCESSMLAQTPSPHYVFSVLTL